MFFLVRLGSHGSNVCGFRSWMSSDMSNSSMYSVYVRHVKCSGRWLRRSSGCRRSTAAEHDLVLVTRSERDFQGCGIRVYNPFKGSALEKF
jgi:hypothetical protein